LGIELGNNGYAIFWVSFEKKRPPVVVLRRILASLVVKSRQSANSADLLRWKMNDLLFISAYGDEDTAQREIAFAHFKQTDGDLPTLRVLGSDGTDKRGNKNRNAALLQALEDAEKDFETTFGFSRGGITAWALTISNPETTVCLQAVDYFLWALQRLYEPKIHPVTGEITREVRYLHALWNQIAEIHDLHFGPPEGTFFTKANPLTPESRFPLPKPKRKKP
jgi:hypothetical protein